MKPSLESRHISVRYGSGVTAVQALSDVSLSFTAGELTLVMGPSASRKTTLLSALGGLLTPDSGKACINGSAVKGLSHNEASRPRDRSIAYVFQAFRHFKSLAALENAPVALEISGVHGGKACEKPKQALDMVAIVQAVSWRHPESFIWDTAATIGLLFAICGSFLRSWSRSCPRAVFLLAHRSTTEPQNREYGASSSDPPSRTLWRPDHVCLHAGLHPFLVLGGSCLCTHSGRGLPPDLVRRRFAEIVPRE